MEYSHRRVGMLAALTLIGLAGCGSPDQASGPVQTIEPVGPRSYVTVAPLPPPPTTAPPAPPAAGEVTTVEVIHVAQSGETLAAIAAAYQVDLAELIAHNGFASDHQVVLNERVRIPAGAIMPSGPSSAGQASDAGSSSSSEESAKENDGGATTGANSGSDDSGDGGESNTASQTKPTSASEEGCTYTIVNGDNPSKVARKTGVDVKALQAANESSGVLVNFLVGDKLYIPPPGKC